MAITGISKDLLFYLERQGFIKPKKEVVGKIDRRWWTEKEVEKIRSIYEYTKDGLPPKEAAKRAICDLERSKDIEKSDKSELASRLKELKILLENNPKLTISTQGSLELKDKKLLDAIIQTIKLVLEDKSPPSAKYKINFDTFFREIKISKIFLFTKVSIERICKDMGIDIREVDYPENLFGISCIYSSERYYVFINKKYGQQKNYILAHELLHIFSENTNKTREFLLRLLDENLYQLGPEEKIDEPD